MTCILRDSALALTGSGAHLHLPEQFVILVIMFSDPKYQSDHGSVGEELMMNVPELEEKGAVVNKVVREGYFTFPDALSAYRLSEFDYAAYLLLKK